MNTPRTMITFKENGFKFTYRVCGIIIHDQHVLFQRGTTNPEHIFWFLPGGRAELGESAQETLKREMLEELNSEITIERLLYVMENFFVDSVPNTPHHEIGFYFLMHLPLDSYLLQGQETFMLGEEDGLPMIFDWLPVDKLEEHAVLPAFLRTALHTLPLQTTHIVQSDRKM
jgi:ADP-ribose pyrophosphatase YjhB (NUDIX family)